VSLDEDWTSYGVADYLSGDKVELDITQLVKDWVKGTKANRGFMLAPEFAEEKADFSVKSGAGVKAQVFIYFTEPEVTSKE